MSEIRIVRRKVTLYAPGQQPAFPDGLYAEELEFPDGLPEPQNIEVRYDPETKTLKLFTKAQQ